MRQPRGEFDLPLEPLGPEHGGQLGSQDLDRDGSMVPEVVGEVHRCHAPGAELPLDAVPLGECRGEAFLNGYATGIHALSLSREPPDG